MLKGNSAPSSKVKVVSVQLPLSFLPPPPVFSPRQLCLFSGTRSLVLDRRRKNRPFPDRHRKQSRVWALNDLPWGVTDLLAPTWATDDLDIVQ